MDASELKELVGTNQVEMLVDRLSTLNEKQRKAMAPAVRDMLDWRHKDRYPRWPVVLAALGCLGGERQVARGLEWVWGLDRVDALGARVLRDRAPHWLEKLPQALLAGDARHWRLVRSLVREGVVTMPEDPNYYIHLVWGSVPSGDLRSQRMLDVLEQDPGLLDHEIWQLLATERAGRQLTTTDANLRELRLPRLAPQPSPERTWCHALVTLASVGRIDRGRLIDATLSAPLRDWAAADVTWFLGLHEALEPTQDEVLARQATYCRLLTCDHGPAVKAAQKLLGALVSDQRLEVDALVAASRVTLSRSDKASVLAQLRLLSAVRKVRPGYDAAIDDVVRVAVDHPRSDVRERALAMLAEQGISDSAPPAVAFASPEPDARATPAQVQAVADADELAELLLRLLEEADDPIEVERALDGLARFHADAPSSTHDVLARRAAERCEDWVRLDLRYQLAKLTGDWLTTHSLWDRLKPQVPWEQPFISAPPQGSLMWLQNLRIGELSRALKAGRAGSVALPTRADGSIEAAVLKDRLERVGRREVPGAADLALALLRVPPSELTEDLLPRSFRERWVRSSIALLRTWSPEWERAKHTSKGVYRFSGDETVLTFRTLSALPVDGGPVSRLLDRDAAVQSAGWEAAVGDLLPRFEQLLALWTTYLPHHPDLLAAHLHPVLFKDLTRARGASAPVLDYLGRAPGGGRVAASALVLGLAAKDVAVRTAAQDALLERAAHGELDGAALGVQASCSLDDDTVVGKRIVESLGTVARAGDSAVLPVLDALEVLLPTVATRRDAGAFVELTADLAERCGRRPVLPVELVALGTGKASSQAAKAARRLLR